MAVDEAVDEIWGEKRAPFKGGNVTAEVRWALCLKPDPLKWLEMSGMWETSNPCLW